MQGALLEDPARMVVAGEVEVSMVKVLAPHCQKTRLWDNPYHRRHSSEKCRTKDHHVNELDLELLRGRLRLPAGRSDKYKLNIGQRQITAR